MIKRLFIVWLLAMWAGVAGEGEEEKPVTIPGDAYTAYNIPAGGAALRLNINSLNANIFIDDSTILLDDQSDAV